MRKPSKQINIRFQLLLMASIGLLFCLPVLGQSFQTKKETAQKGMTFYPYTHIDTESIYSDSSGISVLIQNSHRKGGGYTNAEGNSFFSAIYWYRIINQTSHPLELSIHFPGDSFPALPSEDSYVKVFLLKDTMSIAKEGMYAYGATSLPSVLDAGLKEATQLTEAIAPRGTSLFYISALFYHASTPSGAELVVRRQKFFYKIGGLEIPCGEILIKK